jgi:hypothetical protein
LLVCLFKIKKYFFKVKIGLEEWLKVRKWGRVLVGVINSVVSFSKSTGQILSKVFSESNSSLSTLGSTITTLADAAGAADQNLNIPETTNTSSFSNTSSTGSAQEEGEKEKGDDNYGAFSVVVPILMVVFCFVFILIL